MRRLVCLILASATAFMVSLATPAIASCSGPSLRVSPATAPAGAQVTVSGEDYRVGCNDMGGQGPEPHDAPRLLFKQGEREVELARRVQATGDRYRIERRVTVPAWATPGPATVFAHGSAGKNPVEFTVSRRELAHTGRGPSVGALSAALLALATLRHRRAREA